MRWNRDPLLWPFTGAKLMLDACAWWLGGDIGLSARSGGPELAWTTPHRIALQLSTMRLRDFSTEPGGNPVLVCAPYALHGALIVDFAPEHSIVEALQREGLNRVYVTDWRSADADMRYLTIDNYLSDLNVAIDEIGPPVDLVGLCQGGWLALVFAARFPKKVRRLVLAAAPVDVSAPSPISQSASALPPEAFESMVGAGTGLVSGRKLRDTWARQPSPQEALQRDLIEAGDVGRKLLERFEAWNGATIDLPGAYYLEVVNAIFRENRIAAGRFVALGHRVDPADVAAPVFLLAGANDEIVPPAQAFATASLLRTPAALIETACEPCGHLGLFMGHNTIAGAWRRIAHWLALPSPRRVTCAEAGAESSSIPVKPAPVISRPAAEAADRSAGRRSAAVQPR
jgi:poly(3-hydroxyalkanoate) synthetase